MNFFARYGTGWPTTTTVRTPTTRTLRKAHAVPVTSALGATSLCGRSRLPADIDDRERDFAQVDSPVRCAVCAGLAAAFERSARNARDAEASALVLPVERREPTSPEYAA